MKLGEFLNQLAGKVGQQSSADLVSLLSNSELANTEIADALATALNTGLMSLDGAKQSADVLKHFRPIILKGIDDQMSAYATEAGFADDYGKEDTSYKKLGLVIAKAKEAVENAKKGGGKNDAEIQRLTAKLQDLQNQQVTAIAAKDAEIKRLNDQFAAETLSMLINNQLSGKQYANESVSNEINVKLARLIVDDAIKAKKAIVVNDGGTLRLKQADAPELDLLDEGHKPVTFSDLIDQALAASGTLKASQQQTPKTTPTSINVQQTQGEVRGFDEAMAASLNALK